MLQPVLIPGSNQGVIIGWPGAKNFEILQHCCGSVCHVCPNQVDMGLDYLFGISGLLEDIYDLDWILWVCPCFPLVWGHHSVP
eukprot:14278907-Ditylum_brightwellii.AAC.1